MTVKSILDQKGRSVVTILRSDSLREAIDILATKRIGALVVVDSSNQVEGILSERDIVRVICKQGVSVLEDAAESVMTRSVVTCEEHHTIPRVMELMTDGRFRHLPVVDDSSKLSGMISIGDVVRRRIEDAEREAEDVKAYLTM